MARRITGRISTAVLAAVLVMPVAALAHHGWRWTAGENISLTGLITAVRLGNPHGLVAVDVEGEPWTVEVGQPWRNERAGLTDADFAIGREIRVEGEPDAAASRRVIKAERLWFDGQRHELYPERD
ncbi:DUF6152 family protein [Thiocapsa roseopersicina]|uniref:Uncharacterized protein n=1 Tax=Thiocapsa roseopersicina TaxID=1058 RepID=A0A1H3D4B6_THIRO|nr:DUF6152 family protein [Thiocapsa roseopersicina]SDX60614.1 hypothetical protein SAMN05421783_14125 [Thiocapsa roseopersicina]